MCMYIYSNVFLNPSPSLTPHILCPPCSSPSSFSSSSWPSPSPHSPPLSSSPSASSSSSAATTFITNLAVSSLTGARHLRSPNVPSLSLYPHSYGSYSLDLSLGTPLQSVSHILDTSADLVWVPCTTSYLCRNCSSYHPPRPFLPYNSSSSKPVHCRNPKCTMLHPTSSLSSCTTSTNCYPPYSILSNSGSTTGYLFAETLNLHSKRVELSDST